MTSTTKKKEELTAREVVLESAKTCVLKDRNNIYGPPSQDFTRTASMLSSLGITIDGKPLTGHHVAMIQICLKLSRLTWSPQHSDSWIDVAGYAACGYECVGDE